jgi:hypothetical protein
MTNRHGLDTDYFSKKLKLVLEGINSYTPDEMARELARLAITADARSAGVEFIRYNEQCNYGNK